MAASLASPTNANNALLTPPVDSMAVEPYSMHVSARYMELTKRKLELTRMPREIPLEEERKWALGTPKAVLEPLVDYWVESYDWRAQEASLNSSLKQFRTVITHPPPPLSSPETQDLEAAIGTTESLRIHFLHQTSRMPTAIPLLYVHGYPGSFLEVTRCIEALTDPVETPTGSTNDWRDPIAFHVVAPSTPGFAFSDASSKEDFGARETASVYVTLMKKLGYERFCVWGDGFGFKVARMLAMWFPEHVAGVYTSNALDLPAPQLLKNKGAWLRWQVARFTNAKIPNYTFGYVDSDFDSTAGGQVIDKKAEGADRAAAEARLHEEGDMELDSLPMEGLLIASTPAATDEPGPAKRLEALEAPTIQTRGVAPRPQTLAYGLCDSPVGLLALLLDILRPTISQPPSKRLGQGRKRSDTILEHPPPLQLGLPPPTFSPAEILNFTMMYWLPGPEASLRWLLATETQDAYERYSAVPLGITWYAGQVGSPIWASALQDLKWVQRRGGSLGSGIPAWERSAETVVDLREFFGRGRGEGWLGL